MSTSDSSSFRIPARRGSKPSDPESLFRSLSGRSTQIQHLWAHQADVLRSWHSKHLDTSDLALELPTGTGKTLIGLLIGDFVRQTKEERVAYLCPNRQLAHQVGKLAKEYSIDGRVLVGKQLNYDPSDFNAFVSSSAIAITTYSAIFNINPRIDSANLLILDDAHASEGFIASLWNVEIDRDDHHDIYIGLLDFFRNEIPGSQWSNLKGESTLSAQTECGKIPSPIAHKRQVELRDYLDSVLEETDKRFSWRMIRGHLDACHIFVTWPTISIRPMTPPTFDHEPFSKPRQKIYMSATLGEGGELERITGIRKIERLPVPEGWDKQGPGRRFIMFPDLSLPAETSKASAITLAGEPVRSLILTPTKNTSKSVIAELKKLSPSPSIFTATEIEHSLQPFLEQEHAALVLHNRYDGLDLPGDACHLEWICGLPGATNAQEAFLLNRLGVQSLLRDRIKTRLTQALGRCTRNATDHAVVIISGSDTLDFCNKIENRSGFHPELQAEIKYGLDDVSKVEWPSQFTTTARAFLRKEPGWEEVDEWIREERDNCQRLPDVVEQTLMSNVPDEIDYDHAMWVGDYKRALEKAQACADRLSGNALADYRAWWYYLAGSAAALSMTRDHAPHLAKASTDLFSRACDAAPRSTWFREVVRLVDSEIDSPPIEDPLLLTVAETIEKRIQMIGVAGVGFEKEATVVARFLESADATSFEQGLEKLGYWLGVDASRPSGQGVPDGIWSFGEEQVVAFEAKSNEQPTGPISLNTAREAQGHVNWVISNRHLTGSTPVSTVVISDRERVAREALPNAVGLFVASLTSIRELGRRILSTVRSLRAQASETGNEDFRQVIAERLKSEGLDPQNIQAELLGNRLSDFPVEGSSPNTEKG